MVFLCLFSAKSLIIGFMGRLTQLKILFASLYFVQGGAISYISLFQKPYLHQNQVDTQTIALLSSLLILPFVLKILFGLLSDRIPFTKWGKRKPLMVLGLSLACLSFFLCSLFSPKDALLAYSVCVISASFFVAFFDAATDGLAIDCVEEKDQGKIQAAMVAGKALGVIVLSLSIGQLVHVYGYPFVFSSIAIIFLLPLAMTFTIKERPTDLLTKTKVNYSKAPLLLLSLYGILYSVVSFGSDGLITLYLVKTFQLKENAIGNFGSLRGTGAIAGSLLCGLFYSRQRKAASLCLNFIGLLILALGVLCLSFLLNQSNFLPIALIWGAIWGFQEVCFLTLVMHYLKGTGSAFAFASLMAMANLGTALGEGVATSLTEYYSFSKVFLFLALSTFLPATILLILHQRQSRYNGE